MGLSEWGRLGHAPHTCSREQESRKGRRWIDIKLCGQWTWESPKQVVSLALCLSQLPELLSVISIPWNRRLWHGWAHTSVAASWAGVDRHTVDEVTENQPKH